MVEIRPTEQSGLSKPTRPGLVQPALPRKRICYFLHNILRSNTSFLNWTCCFHGLYGGDSVSLTLRVPKIGSRVSNYFWCTKWVILHDHMPPYRYSMSLIHRVIAFPPPAILSGMFYPLVFRGCWYIMCLAALISYSSYSSIISECLPGCHSESHEIFIQDWSGTSLNRTGPPKLVGSSHRHQPGLASLVLRLRFDWADYSEPWLRIVLRDCRSSSRSDRHGQLWYRWKWSFGAYSPCMGCWKRPCRCGEYTAFIGRGQPQHARLSWQYTAHPCCRGWTWGCGENTTREGRGQPRYIRWWWRHSALMCCHRWMWRSGKDTTPAGRG